MIDDNSTDYLEEIEFNSNFHTFSLINLLKKSFLSGKLYKPFNSKVNMQSKRNLNSQKGDGTPTGGIYQPLLKGDYQDYRLLMTKYQNQDNLNSVEAVRLAGYFEKILAAYNFETGKSRTDVDLGLSELRDIPEDRIPVFKETLRRFINDHHDLIR